MTDTPNTPNGPSESNDSAQQEQQQPGQTHSPGSTPNPNRRLVDAVRMALKNGANDARTAADRAVPAARSLASQAAYGLAYGVAFGAVFTYSLVEHITPECMKSGWTDGVKEGRESGTHTAEILKAEPPPIPPAMQPGTAS